MLQNTFCHLPGVGFAREQELWASGVTSWESFLEDTHLPFFRTKRPGIEDELRRSRQQLENRQVGYFAERLPSREQWRMFREFRDTAAYLDIETTGLNGDTDHITTISMYDGATVFYYIYGRNLADFPRDIQRYHLLITYNGKGFDVPFLEQTFHIEMPQAHIDLRYVLRSLGYSGGLKSCEKQVGIHREGLEDVDGFMATILWDEFIRHGNARALETLLAYNIEDAVNLECLMIHGYNRKIRDTPFAESHALPWPNKPKNPCAVDAATLMHLRKKLYGGRFFSSNAAQ